MKIAGIPNQISKQGNTIGQASQIRISHKTLKSQLKNSANVSNLKFNL
jgi:hypothetical protein